MGSDGWGCSRALGHSGLCKSLAEAIQARGRGLPPVPLLSLPACASAGLPLSQSSRRSSAGLSHSALSLHGPGRGGVPASCSPHLYKFLVQPSKSRTQNGPRRLCSHLHLKGSTVTSGSASRYCPPGLRKVSPATCSLGSHAPSLRRPSLRGTRLSQPRAASPGSSPGGMIGKNVPIDMYIPQCCTFVCSNHVNTCMDFIIYILYINL